MSFGREPLNVGDEVFDVVGVQVRGAAVHRTASAALVAEALGQRRRAAVVHSTSRTTELIVTRSPSQ
jgi:hypothetical protein